MDKLFEKIDGCDRISKVVLNDGEIGKIKIWRKKPNCDKMAKSILMITR